MNVSEKERELIKKFLIKVPVFRNFSDDHLDQVVGDFKVISAKQGDDIVFQADEGTDLYIVIKGKVKVSLLGPDGNEFILASLKQGDFFGEMSLIDGRTRSANVVAEEETALGALNRGIFLSTMKQKPAIAFDLLSALVERLRKTDDMIEALAFLDVSERLVKLLVHCAQKDGDMDEDGFYRTEKRTHLDLASNIGSSREAVSKALKVLYYKQIIVKKGDYFLIAPDVCDEMGNINF